MRWSWLWVALAVAAPAGAQQGDRADDPQPPLPEHLDLPPAPPLSPEQALESLVVAPGLRVELVASEPLVEDPVTLTIGPDGRMWVVEMRGFMPDVDGTGEDQPVGTVAVLRDRDGDGRMDERTEFASGLVLPRALALVANGVLVGEPPHLWLYQDTDGDGRADHREEVTNEYGAQGNPEHTANGLYRALDNWFYNAKHGVRFRATASGDWVSDRTINRGQWGISQDDTGRIYYNNNSLPLQMDVFPAEYLARNPDLGSTAAAGRTVAGLRDIQVWPARVTPGVNRGYKTLNEEGKITEVTAAGAPLIYRGALFPAEFAGNAFICEPAGNLVKRLVLETAADGAVVGRNAYEGFEVLASTDERFRPVNLTTGPDGAIYVADMYRGIIQHRVFVTTFLRRQIEARGLETPVGWGRIYRLVPDDPPRAGEPVRLDQATTGQLVQALDRPDGWWRDTAQRLLVERADPAAADLLRGLATRGSPLGRLHALWTLEGLGQLTAEDVASRLQDEDERVRAAAVRLTEVWPAATRGNVAALAQDPSPVVRLQVALTLGAQESDEALPTLVALAVEHGMSVGMDEAIVSGLRHRELRFLQQLGQAPTWGSAGPVAEQATATILRRANPEDVRQLFAWAENARGSRAVAAIEAVVGGFERLARLRGPAAQRAGRRLVLPVEPRLLRQLAGLTDSPLAARSHRLLELVDTPQSLAEQQVPVRPLTPIEQERFTAGQAAFAVCAGCHHPDGVGYTGVAPSLVDSRWTVAPEDAIVRIILHGKEGDSFGMPPLNALDDATIAAITTYIRRAWRQKADPVSPETVARIRAAEQQRDRPWTAEELEQLIAAAPSP